MRLVIEPFASQMRDLWESRCFQTPKLCQISVDIYIGFITIRHTLKATKATTKLNKSLS